MTPPLTPAAADPARWARIAESFAHGPHRNPAWIVILFGVALLVIATPLLWRRRAAAVADPFSHLARALRVGPIDRRRLQRLAHLAGWPDAAPALIAQGAFDHLLTLAAPHHARRLHPLRQRLFTDEPPPPSP